MIYTQTMCIWNENILDKRPNCSFNLTIDGVTNVSSLGTISICVFLLDNLTFSDVAVAGRQDRGLFLKSVLQNNWTHPLIAA
jgi:hypothetical protein